MADLNPLSWWRRFLTLPNDSRMKTFVVAFLVASVSAAAVTVTAVSLKPRQEANVIRDRQKRMEQMLASVPGLGEILKGANADSLETRIVDLAHASYASGVDPATFDATAVVTDPQRSVALPPEADGAGIGRRPNLAPIYLVRQDGKLLLVVLPVYGSGYQSTIRAYLALRSDLNTIAALSIYEQKETPGLGTRIAEAAWQDRWAGKRVADEGGNIRIAVVRGSGAGPFEVDGITGATRSTNGVSNLVRFWLGPHGFGPFLANLRDGKV
jgi:Na+-transporting NADH:ubiquinone oxidoreductase subunit C